MQGSVKIIHETLKKYIFQEHTYTTAQGGGIKTQNPEN